MNMSIILQQIAQSVMGHTEPTGQHAEWAHTEPPGRHAEWVHTEPTGWHAEWGHTEPTGWRAEWGPTEPTGRHAELKRDREARGNPMLPLGGRQGRGLGAVSWAGPSVCPHVRHQSDLFCLV